MGEKNRFTCKWSYHDRFTNVDAKRTPCFHICYIFQTIVVWCLGGCLVTLECHHFSNTVTFASCDKILSMHCISQNHEHFNDEVYFSDQLFLKPCFQKLHTPFFYMQGIYLVVLFLFVKHIFLQYIFPGHFLICCLHAHTVSRIS